MSGFYVVAASCFSRASSRLGVSYQRILPVAVISKQIVCKHDQAGVSLCMAQPAPWKTAMQGGQLFSQPSLLSQKAGHSLYRWVRGQTKLLP